MALLADRLRGNVRELEGALAQSAPLQPGDGASRSIWPWPMRPWPIGCATRCEWCSWPMSMPPCAGRCGWKTARLQAKGAGWAVSHPRMVAMFLARKHTTAAYSEVGGYFGGRNHSTAVAAEKKVRQWLTDDEEMALGERRLRVRESWNVRSASCCVKRAGSVSDGLLPSLTLPARSLSGASGTNLTACSGSAEEATCSCATTIAFPRTLAGFRSILLLPVAAQVGR